MKKKDKMLGTLALFGAGWLTVGAATLPDGYTAIEYIESTAASRQYVNTGFFPTSNTVLTVDAQCVTPPYESGQLTAIFGTLGKSSVTFKCYAQIKDSNVTPDRNINAYRAQLGHVDAWTYTCAAANRTRTRFTMDAPRKFLSILDSQDGFVYYLFSGIAPGAIAPNALDLMAYCDGSAHGKQVGPLRLYAAAITEGGVAACNFVPCKNSAGVAGLYDTVGAKFYPSSRSDQAFVAGPALMTDTVNAATRSASLTFPASSDARELYLVGASFDSAALATNWTYEAKLADVPANAASLDAVAFPAAFFRAGCKRYRFQIRSTAGAVEATTTTGLSNMRDETGRFNVYSDATALYVGAEDKNDNGLFDMGDWTDVRHAANADSVTHQVSRSGGPATNLEVRTVDVFSPTMEKTLKNQSCVFLRQGVSAWTEGDDTIRKVFPASMNLQNPIVGDTYTFLCRFRPGPYQTAPAKGDTWLLRLGCQWNIAGSFLGFHTFNDAGDSPESYYMTFSNGDNTYSQATDLVVSNQFWHEVAFVVSGAYARVELANAGIAAVQKHRLFKVYENKNAFPPNNAKCISAAPCHYYRCDTRQQYIANGSDAAIVKTNDTYLTKDFRGDIHLAAFWNRALSHDEIIEAFADAQPSQWRVGMTGCSADVLNGTTTADVTAGTDPSEWRKIPRTLVRGQKLTLSFTIADNQTNLTQAVRLVPAATADATVAFKLDSTYLGSARLSGTDPTLVFARKNLMTAGDHTLTVERTDEGSTPLAIDSLEMCGSWQIGVRNGSAIEFGLYGEGETERSVIPLAARQYPGTASRDTTLTFHFYVPGEFLGKARFRYVTQHPYWRSDTDNTLSYVLNGTEIGTEENRIRTNVVMDFPMALLKAGENVLQIKMTNSTQTAWAWVQHDFHRLEMRVLSGFSLFYH